MTAIETTPHAVRIGRSVFPFTSYPEVSSAYCQARDQSGSTATGATGPQAPKAEILDHDGNVIAHVSYNGKIWRGAEWISGTSPLFNPYD